MRQGRWEKLKYVFIVFTMLDILGILRWMLIYCLFIKRF